MELNHILDARSVAVVGASRNPTKRGYQAIKILLDEHYDGRIYPVNPKESRILGLKCYAKVSDIPEPVDLALITTPAKTIPAILADCGRKGVKGAVVIAGGFREVGEEGRRLEEDMVAEARRQHIRLIGPNTSGMMNLKSNLNLVGMHDVPRGEVALLSQSGNMALTLITEARLKSKLGFTYYVGVGNEADIRFHEYLAFLRRDPDTKAVLMYVEGMKDGRSFLAEARRTTQEKPVVLLKSGRSDTGRRSAGSHTGALAGGWEVARTAFGQAGVVLLTHSDELIPVVEALACQPPLEANRLAILADGGGHATIAADLLSDLGVEIPELSPRTQERLREILPFTASVRNPVDVAGGTDADPSLFADCARIILEDPGVSGLLMVGLFGGYGIRFAESLAVGEEEAAHRLGRLSRELGKPVIVHSLFAPLRPHALELLRHYRIPVYESLDIACRAVAELAHYGRYRRQEQRPLELELRPRDKAKPEGRRILEAARREGRGFLLEHEARQLLRLHGLPVPPERLAADPEEAVAAWRELGGGRVVLKVVSPQILHKSDAGGVKLGLADAEAVRRAWQEIADSARAFDPGAELRGVLVTPQVEAEGVEVIVGAKHDEQFGPVIMFGLGGIMVEVMRDVVFRLVPLDRPQAAEMVRAIRGYPLLAGARGRTPLDTAALERLLVVCSEVMEAYPEIAEMDLNPVLVQEEGVAVLDARVILGG